jgi:hypothetical protein
VPDVFKLLSNAWQIRRVVFKVVKVLQNTRGCICCDLENKLWRAP